jgi:hypothetical protein
MAIISSYPTITPTSSDLVLVVDTSEDGNPTKTATVGSINASATAPDIQVATKTITNAQLRTLGTTPVVILPGVVGYGYQILGLTTQAKNAGGIGDSYNWSSQDGLFSWRTSNFAGTHRVEIPNSSLPSGGAGLDVDFFVGTPIAGIFRFDDALLLGVTSNINPITVAGQDPVATWVINVTYRLIKAS